MPPAATGGALRRFAGLCERLRNGRTIFSHAREQLDFSLRRFQELLAMLEMLDPLFIAGQRLGQPELALF